VTKEDLTSCTRERSFGHFRRSISQPTGIDASRINAAFEEDLLESIIQGGANLTEPQRIRIGNWPHRASLTQRWAYVSSFACRKGFRNAQQSDGETTAARSREG
jgi:hypothetical protein